MPLQLAYAITIHRCQGLEAGFDEGDRWKRIILDPSDTNWEIQYCLGTCYVATSRGKTFGSKTDMHPKDSAIYWTGCNVSIDRIQNCKRKRNGQECESFKKRKRWVDHLNKKAEKTKTKFNKRKLDEITRTTLPLAMNGKLITDRNDLMTKIVTMIENPNQAWKKAKPTYELPRNYFD